MASKSMDYSAALRRYEERYDALKAQLQTVGFIGQGSIQTRHLKCGKPTCRCYDDPDARHGPYHYWTRKVPPMPSGRLMNAAPSRGFEGIGRAASNGSDRVTELVL